MCTMSSAQGRIVHEDIYILIIIDTVDEDVVNSRSWWHVIDEGEEYLASA